MELSEAFGKILKKIRLSRQLSQLELAQAAGLDRTFISMLERGERQPTITTIFEICKVLEIFPSDLILEAELLLRLRKNGRPPIPSRRL